MAYLSTIKDGSSNDILAYHVSDSIKLDIAITTINKLITHHKDDLHESAFVHSDQGFHYTSPKFQKLLKRIIILVNQCLVVATVGTMRLKNPSSGI